MSLKSKLSIFGAYFFRFIGYSIEPMLKKIGNPNQNSPVLVTANFNLTVKRLLKKLKGLNCYLLIAPSNGINVWCGACGGDFTTDSVISIIKTSGINELVSHRTLILPQLSAPGIDPTIIKKELGWNAKFGPVYAKDIKKYIKNNFEKTDVQKRIRFPIKKRLEMANAYYFVMVILFTIIYWILAIFFSNLDLILYLDTLLIGFIIIYGSLIILPSIPSTKGKLKVLIFGTLILFLIILFYIFVYDDLYYLVWNIITTLFVTLVMAEDFHGITPTYKSDLGEKSWKKGKENMKIVFGTFKLQPYGELKLDRDKCIGCKVCLDVCPRVVYKFNETDKKVDINSPKKCINCNACVNRCLAQCLKIEK
ncbi:MAG: HgcAB-like fusion protein [Promethearchaeota archaeon]